jgi:Na+-transporting methylmalonyl-CoA/oxaloacetate decarboxylase gamma subunit
LPNGKTVTISFQNILDNHGFSIAVLGMTIVFAGLTLIALFLSLLPTVLTAIQERRVQRSPRNVTARERRVSEEDNLLAAVTCVVHMELALLEEEDSRVTLEVDESARPAWAQAMHRLREFRG